jgi:hypothetical protein
MKYSAVLGRLETWVVKNSSWLALGIITTAFAIRLAYSGSSYLNPDEAQHLPGHRYVAGVSTGRGIGPAAGARAGLPGDVRKQ